MATAKLTLIGLYNHDSTLFDQMTLPDDIDRDVLINNILFRSGDFEVLYPDPDFLKPAIGVWSKKWQHTFNRWIKALNVEYDPLNNYNRTEEWSISEDIDDTASRSETVTGNTTDHAETETENTVTDRVSAYNNNTLVNDKEQTSAGNGSSSGGSTSNQTVNASDTNERDRTESRIGRAYGNIGVTTSQQMLQAELDISLWNLYEHITDVFLSEFIIPVF